MSNLHAVAAGHVDAARALLDGGACVEGSWTPLARGADGEVPEDQRNPFTLPSLPRPPPRYWCSPLNRAAEYGSAAIVQLLMERGADPRVLTDRQGNTALYIAAKKGRADVVRVLLEAGADPNATRTLNAESPLYAAARSLNNEWSHVEVVRLLLAFGANPVRPPRGPPRSLENSRHRAALFSLQNTTTNNSDVRPLFFANMHAMMGDREARTIARMLKAAGGTPRAGEDAEEDADEEEEEDAGEDEAVDADAGEDAEVASADEVAVVADINSDSELED